MGDHPSSPCGIDKEKKKYKTNKQTTERTPPEWPRFLSLAARFPLLPAVCSYGISVSRLARLKIRFSVRVERWAAGEGRRSVGLGSISGVGARPFFRPGGPDHIDCAWLGSTWGTSLSNLGPAATNSGRPAWSGPCVWVAWAAASRWFWVDSRTGTDARRRGD